MDHTHYADPSGFDQGSQSTAGDLLKVAAVDMANPTFASIVRMSSVTLPVAGTISTYTPWLGYFGVIGVEVWLCHRRRRLRRPWRRAPGAWKEHPHPGGGDRPDRRRCAAGRRSHRAELADHVGASIGVTPVMGAGEVVAHVNVAGHTVAGDRGDDGRRAELARGERPPGAGRRADDRGRGQEGYPDRICGRACWAPSGR